MPVNKGKMKEMPVNKGAAIRILLKLIFVSIVPEI